MLTSRIHDKHLLALGVTTSLHGNRGKDLCQYFTQNGSLVFCNNFPDLVTEFWNVLYINEEWHLEWTVGTGELYEVPLFYLRVGQSRERKALDLNEWESLEFPALSETKLKESVIIYKYIVENTMDNVLRK